MAFEKKYLLWGLLVGIVTACAIGLILFLFLMFSSDQPMESTLGDQSKVNQNTVGELVSRGRTDGEKIKVKVQLRSSIPAKSISFPKKAFLIITTATGPYELQHLSPVVFSWPIEVSSLPADLVFEVSLTPLKQLINKFNHPEELLSFGIMLGDSSLVGEVDKFFGGAPGTSDVFGNGEYPPYNARTEWFWQISDKDIAQGTVLNAGKVYIKEIYSGQPGKPCSNISTITLNIDSFDNRSNPLQSHAGTPYLTAVPDEYGQIFGGLPEVTEALNQGNFDRLVPIFQPIKLKSGEATQSEVKWSRLAGLNAYRHFYVVFCDSSKGEAACKSRFALNYYGKRTLSLKKEYYPLIPRGLMIPRCDELQKDLIFYPLLSYTSRYQKEVDLTGKAVPTEVLDETSAY